MHPLASGFVGASALTAVHETARRVIPDAPRMDVVGARAVTQLCRMAGYPSPGPAWLYPITMAGDLLSNGIYYAAVGSGSRSAIWTRAATLGLAAGLGAVMLPERLGLGKPPHNERARTRVLTVAWYLTGALVAAAVASARTRQEASRQGGQLSPIDKLRRLTDGIEVAMLTTVGESGQVHGRPMMTQRIADDGQVWFFTSAEAGKTHELESHPEVNVAYADAGKQRYVSITGRARLVRDRAKARELWSPAYRAWFPEGLDDPNLALLAVTVESAEYWDSRSSTMVHLAGLAKAVLKGERYRPGDHGRIEPRPSDYRE